MNRSRNERPPGADELIIGRQAVLEALRRGRLEKLYFTAGQRGETMAQILQLAGQRKVPLKEVPRAELNRLAAGGKHQGVVARAPSFAYCTLGELLGESGSSTEGPFFIMLDHLQDPQNLGSLLRTADAAGMDGMIIPQDRSVKITPAVRKVAAGAAERMAVARVVNLADAVEQLKENGFWIYGAEADGTLPYYRVDYRGPFVLAVGSEGQGLSRLLRERCDGIISIPMRGAGGSLNAAVAAAVIIYAAACQREGWESLT